MGTLAAFVVICFCVGLFAFFLLTFIQTVLLLWDIIRDILNS
ncbi:hypothetical protein NXS10_01555 [Streptococcus sp. SQ9-PEA]|uniref:Uncharacterized protein n=1 Tax=Streptococcus sciuri TaxID=2973939 RepID=A0ABT2F751_9STRE|nr:hypothetical protein [Streptococcus sciuri]